MFLTHFLNTLLCKPIVKSTFKLYSKKIAHKESNILALVMQFFNMYQSECKSYLISVTKSADTLVLRLVLRASKLPRTSASAAVSSFLAKLRSACSFPTSETICKTELITIVFHETAEILLH